MGVKTLIEKHQLPKEYQTFNLKETIDGVSDSVYLLGDSYVIKLFENSNKQNIRNEISLLDKLKLLPTAKIIDTFNIDNKHAIVYTQIEGESKNNPDISQIKQIGIFLKSFHNISKNEISSNIKLFEKSQLKDMLQISQNKTLLNYFNHIAIELKTDGIIHGDLFIDNAKFKDDKLTGVYDFSEACQGDFLFDLAVVSISWCFDENILNRLKLDALLESYGTNINYDIFIKYIKYALLYYTTLRYINSRDYKELLIKLEKLI